MFAFNFRGVDAGIPYPRITSSIYFPPERRGFGKNFGIPPIRRNRVRPARSARRGSRIPEASVYTDRGLELCFVRGGSVTAADCGGESIEERSSMIAIESQRGGPVRVEKREMTNQLY